MKLEPVIIFFVVIGGFIFFFGLLPLATLIASLGELWRVRRGTALVLIGVIVNTALLFVLLFFTFFGLVVAGRP